MRAAFNMNGVLVGHLTVAELANSWFVANQEVTRKCTKFGLFLYCRSLAQNTETRDSSPGFSTNDLTSSLEPFLCFEIGRLLLRGAAPAAHSPLSALLQSP